MKRHFLYSILVLMLSLVAATAMAEQCKPVHAQLGEMVFYDPGCMLDGVTYYWCAERPTLGTINGTYRFYSAPRVGWLLPALGIRWPWLGRYLRRSYIKLRIAA